MPFAHQGFIPAWFVVVFLLFAVVQLFAINSLDMYSSGVTLQAIGVPVKRYQAVLVDCVIAFMVTMYAIFSSSFTTYLKDFVDVVIVWIAPWVAIFLVDWALRGLPLRAERAAGRRADVAVLELRRRVLAGHLRAADSACSPPSRRLSATFLPHWLNEITLPQPGRRLQRLHGDRSRRRRLLPPGATRRWRSRR